MESTRGEAVSSGTWATNASFQSEVTVTMVMFEGEDGYPTSNPIQDRCQATALQLPSGTIERVHCQISFKKEYRTA